MLGHRLFRRLGKNNDFQVTGTARKISNSDQWFSKEELLNIIEDVDVTNYDKLMNVFAKIKPDTVINCVGIIKQLPISKDPLTAITINALFPHKLALACEVAGARLIHLSTDCVFSGKKGNYSEEDDSDANDIYGRSKFLGEVKKSNCITLRTSIIGHELNSKRGLLEWFLAQKGPVNGYKHAIYTGFPTIEIARIISEFVIPNLELNGLYHVSSEPISKFDLLKLIADYYKKEIEIRPYKEFKCDRSLRSTRFRKDTGYLPPAWSELIRMMYDDFQKYN